MKVGTKVVWNQRSLQGQPGAIVLFVPDQSFIKVQKDLENNKNMNMYCDVNEINYYYMRPCFIQRV